MTGLFTEDNIEWNSPAAMSAKSDYKTALTTDSVELAVECLVSSAQQENMMAQYVLAKHHLGQETPDPVTGIYWLRKAAANGLAESYIALVEAIYDHCWDDSEARAEAVCYWELARLAGIPEARHYKPVIDSLKTAELFRGLEIFNESQTNIWN